MLNRKYIDEICKIYNKRDVKQLAYFAYIYRFSEVCNTEIDERWLLYEIGRNLKNDDLKYILSFLKSGEKEKISFSANLLSNIFNLNNEDKEFLKECVLNAKELSISSNFIAKLLKCINDIEFSKECIRNSKKLELDSFDMYDVIRKSNDVEFMKSCVENSVKIGLSSNDSIFLINEITQKNGDDNFKLACIENWNSLNFNSNQVSNLLLSIKDQSKIIKYIENWKSYGLNNNNVSFIVRNSKMKKYAKSIIERAEEFELDIDDVYDIISALDDKKYVKKAIENGTLDKLDSYCMGNLIYKTNDRKFIKSCLENCKKLNLEEPEIDQLRALYKQLEFLKFNKSQRANIVDNYGKDYIRRVDLPKYMTFGIEIECVGNAKKSNMKKIIKKMGSWQCKGDKSISGNTLCEDGFEFVSPILFCGGKNPTDEIRNICALLNYFDFKSNKTCGGHVHIGGKDLQSVEAYKNLLELWANTERIIYLISNAEGTVPRSAIDPYAFPISKNLLDTLKRGTINLTTENDLGVFKENIRKFEENRYKGLNITNMDPQVMKINKLPTIEFRIPNGTVNADVWIENINFFGGLMNVSNELAKIKAKTGKISEKEQLMLKQFEELKKGNLTEEQKLNILLNLTVPEQLKSIYISRYKKNSKLLNNFPELVDFFKENITDNPIDISKPKKNITSDAQGTNKAEKKKLQKEDDYAR